jgi:hypothetical protein
MKTKSHGSRAPVQWMFGLFLVFSNHHVQTAWMKRCLFTRSSAKTFDQHRRLLPSIRKRINGEDTRSVHNYGLRLVRLCSLVWRLSPKEPVVMSVVWGGESF